MLCDYNGLNSKGWKQPCTNTPGSMFFSETSMSSAQQLNDFVRWAVGPWRRILDLKYKYFKCKRKYLVLNVVFEDKGQREKEEKKEKGSY